MPDENTGAQTPAQNNVTQPSVNAGASAAPAPGVPPAPANDVPTPSMPTTSDTDAGNYMAVDEPQQNTPTAGNGTSNPDDLLNIKQQALQQLSPLVGHLEQSPEDEFRTTMMMIQASDDQSLVQKAYNAAQKIGDEKARAQALLDIVNEINYFTQHKNNQTT